MRIKLLKEQNRWELLKKFNLEPQRKLLLSGEPGTGKTMTAQDILEGRLIIEIGLAVVRPAEFIILKFTHKLPEA